MNFPVWAVLPLFQSSPRQVVEMVRAAESLGMAGVLTPDHLAGWRSPSGPVLEAAIVLGMVGAVAECRVGSLVLQTGVRSPSHTARVAETLSAVALKPPLIGLGVGGDRSRRELRRLGMEAPSPAESLERLRLTIAAVRSRTPDTEVWVGGWKPELVELAAEMADGWNAWGGQTSDFERAAAHVRSLNPATHTSWGGLLPTDRPPEELRHTLISRIEAGARSLVLAPVPPRAENLRRLGPALFDHPIFHAAPEVAPTG